MSQATFSHQFAQRWLKQPEKVKHAIVQELDDIVTLLDENTDIDTFEFTIDNLSAYIEKTYEEDRLNKIKAHAEAQALALKNSRTTAESPTIDDDVSTVDGDEDAQNADVHQIDESNDSNSDQTETGSVEDNHTDVDADLTENAAIEDTVTGETTETQDGVTLNSDKTKTPADNSDSSEVEKDTFEPDNTLETDSTLIEDNANQPEKMIVADDKNQTEAPVESVVDTDATNTDLENAPEQKVTIETNIEEAPIEGATVEEAPTENHTTSDADNTDNETADDVDQSLNDKRVNDAASELDEEVGNTDDKTTILTEADTVSTQHATDAPSDNSTQILLNAEDIEELEARIDDYISEEMVKISLNIKSWLHDQIKQIQKN